MDDDLDYGFAMRLSPDKKWKPIHRYQHIYAFIVYPLGWFFWVFNDFKYFKKYTRLGLIKPSHNLAKEYVIYFVSKAIYFTYLFVIPFILLDISWWQLVIGISTLYWVASTIMYTVFQMAHITDHVDMIGVKPGENIENAWAVHQMHTTGNFSAKNSLITWFTGALNFQIEHHLFTGICHVHLKNISGIVKKVAEEFGVPYNEHPNFLSAIKAHLNHMKELGQVTTVSIPERHC